MPLRDDLLNPIAGSNPSGSNLRYDPVTDKVKEARREELDVPQGAWKTAVKTADFAQVIKLASDAIATKGKDLQLAVWLVDAHIKKEGFPACAPCFEFLHQLCEQFWDTIYPEIEDGDLEVRAAPLEWLGAKLEEPIRLLPVISGGLSWFKWQESRKVGYEADAVSEEKRKERKQAINDGKLTAEEFDVAVDETPKANLELLQKHLEAGQEALNSLTEFLDEKFGDVSPSFLKTRAALDDTAQLVKQLINKKGGATVAAPPAAVSEPPAAPVAAAAPVVEPAAPAPQPVASAPQASYAAPSAAPAGIPADPIDKEDAAKRVGSIARFLLEKDKYDISAFLISRGFRWGEIRYNGPEIDRGMLWPPSEAERSALQNAFNAGNWDETLKLTERLAISQAGRAWLDLHRYTVRALESKGPYFAFMADAVRTGVRGLIRDLPGLLDLYLRDGQPCADDETRAWIENEVMSGEAPVVRAPAPAYQPPVEAAPPATPPPPPPAAPAIDLAEAPPVIDDQGIEEDETSDVFGQALKAARANKPAEAFSIVNRQLSAERSGRGRFRRKVQLAHLLVATGRSKIARPILEDLYKEIDGRKLEDWEEGESIAYPLSLLARCLEADAPLRAELYASICRLDPVRALDLDGGGR